MTETQPEADAREQAQPLTEEPPDPALLLDHVPDEVDEADAWEQAAEVAEPDDERR